MKKFLLTALAVFVLLPAYAQEKKHTFNIAFETESYNYREPKMDHAVRWDGTMSGVSLEYVGRSVFTALNEIDPGDPSFLSMELRYMQGSVDYEGWVSTSGPNPVYTKSNINDIDDYYMEGRLLAGAVYQIPNSGVEFRPYFGFGIRYLVDKLNEKSESGYRRTSNYVYVPIGFITKFTMSKGWALSLNPEFDWFLSGRQRSRLSDIPGYAAFGTIKNKQDEGYGLRMSAKLEKSFGATGLFVEPFVRYWRVQKSDEVYGSYEPNNETKEWGVKIGLSF